MDCSLKTLPGASLTVLLVIQTSIYAKLPSDTDLNKFFCKKEINCGDIQSSSALSQGQKLSSYQLSPCKGAPNCTCSNYANVKLGQVVNCSGKSFKQVPEGLPRDTTLMYLRSNRIQEIAEGIFDHYRQIVFLDLSHNRIIKLSRDTFNGLNHLQYLLLNGNKIRYDTASIHPEAFSPLQNLTNLQFQQNLRGIRNNETYPGDAFAKLAQLQCLGLDGLPHKAIPKSFTLLKSLNTITFNGFDGRCNLLNLTKTMLEPFSKLTHLQVRNCGLNNIERSSFSLLVNLQLLDLSYNEELEFKNLPNIAHGLNRTALRSLCLNKIHKTFGGCTVITAQDLEYLGDTELQYIAIESNRLSILDVDAVRFIPKTLKGISVEDNMLLIGVYIIEILEQMKYRFSELRTLILAKQHMPHTFRKLYTNYKLEQKSTSFYNQTQQPAKLSSVISDKHLQLNTPASSVVQKNSIEPPAGQLKERLRHSDGKQLRHNIQIRPKPEAERHDPKTETCSNCIAVKAAIQWLIPPKLKILDFSDFILNMHLQNLCFCEPNTLNILRFSGNLLWQWTGPASGMKNLTELDMSRNYCQNITFDILQGMPNLQIFNASRNILAFTLSQDSEGEIFSKQNNLQSLDLSDNKIQFIPERLLEGLVHLKNISLSQNQLTNISFNIDHMNDLRHVNLRNNFLEQVDSRAREHFDRIAHANNLTLDLSYNRFKCNCDNLEFIKWLSQTDVQLLNRESYTCEFDNKTIGNLTLAEEIYQSLERKCTNYLSLILSTVAMMMVLIVAITSALVYRYRWDLRYMYYSAKIRSRKYFPLNDSNIEYDHDVFVSYADREGWFVRRCLVPELEEKRGIRLLVHDRDFRPGNFVTDNIMQAITTSRKTLIILSQSFLKSSWCCYEMNMARMEGIKTGRSVLCILMKEEVSLSGLPLEIIEVIEQQTYACVPDNPEQEQEFWHKLKSSLLD